MSDPEAVDPWRCSLLAGTSLPLPVTLLARRGVAPFITALLPSESFTRFGPSLSESDVSTPLGKQQGGL